MKILLNKSLVPAGYGYLAGTECNMGTDLGDLLVKHGWADLLSDKPDGIPRNAPSIENYLKYKKVYDENVKIANAKNGTA